MSAKKRAKGTLTIDMARGVYVQQDARGVRESAYRSERSAARVADYLKWRGYTVRVIGQAKKKGEDRKMNSEQIEKNEVLAKALHHIKQKGIDGIDGRRVRSLRMRGMIDEHNQLTNEGGEFMAQYLPETSANNQPEAELSEVKAAHNGNGHKPIVVEEWAGRVVSSTPVKQEDKARVVLRSVRGRLLGIVRESLPDGLRGLVDEVEQINEILDE